LPALTLVISADIFRASSLPGSSDHFVVPNKEDSACHVAVDESRDRLYAIDRAASAGATSYLRTFSLK
jgi:hypothetical protein